VYAPDVSDLQLRQRIIESLNDHIAKTGGVVTRKELSAFMVDGEPRRLIDQSKGIWNPRGMDATLSILSSPDGPYRDDDLGGGLIHYAYRAGNDDGDNLKLRRACELAVPIILLQKIEQGVFVAICPAYVVHDDREKRRFLVAVHESLRFLPPEEQLSPLQREYAERVLRQRLHQPVFRGRVIRAYETQCAVCALKHGELLDAAHIIPDGEEDGLAVVSNGLSLCKIHHAAYDKNLLGIDPDRRIVIREDLRTERDGPMLRYGLQEMHGRRLILPVREADHPDRHGLAKRFEAFKKAA
jgi:putative restriction endonuclease